MTAPPRAGQAPPWLSLSCIGLGLIALLTAHVALLVRGETLLRHFLLPGSVALAHLFVLGWLTLVMMGALYQLTPVIAQAPLASVRLAVVQVVLYVAGVGGLVQSFAFGGTGSLPVHAAGAVAGVALFLLNIALTLRRVAAWTAPARYLAAAVALLGATVALGLLFALDLRYGWFPLPAGRIAIHAHLGIAGWMGLLLAGVSYRLVPMFALVRGHSERLAVRNLALLCAALVALALALTFGLRGAALVAPAMALGAGYLIYVTDMTRLYRRRLRRRLDLYAWALFASLGCLALTVVLGVLAAGGAPQRWVGEVRWTVAYAYAALGGWLTLAIIGHSYKIVPMLVWQARYASAPPGAAPLLTEMYARRPAALSLAFYAAGFCVTLAALLLGDARALRTGAAIGTAGVMLYEAIMLYVAVGRHAPQRSARPAAPPAGAPTGGGP